MHGVVRLFIGREAMQTEEAAFSSAMKLHTLLKVFMYHNVMKIPYKTKDSIQRYFTVSVSEKEGAPSLGPSPTTMFGVPGLISG
jgi:hypothetical protein